MRTLLALVGALVHVGCAQTIWERLAANPDATTSVQYLQRMGLETTLRQGTTSLTVFIPTEAAWDAAGRGGERLFEYNTVDLDNTLRYHIVSGVSLNSVQSVQSSPLATIQGGTLSLTQSIPTGSQQTGFVVNGISTITTENVAGSNGMIHYINRVLVPNPSLTPSLTIYEFIRNNSLLYSTLDSYLQADPTLIATLNTRLPRWHTNGVPGTGSPILYTFFAPTNAAFAALTTLQTSELMRTPGLMQRVLNYHVSETYLAYDLGSNILTNTQLDLLTFDAPNTLQYNTLPTVTIGALGVTQTFLINPLNFATSASPTVNGILISTDTVLFPPDVLLPLNIMEVLAARTDSALTSAKLISTGLNQFLENGGSIFTVFSPSDAAWAKLTSGVRNLIERDSSVAQSVMSYHILQGVQYGSAQLRVTSSATTVQGGSVDFVYNTNQAGFLYVNTKSKIVVADQIASNGVVHIIDEFLIPPVAPLSTMTTIVGVVGAQPVQLSRINQILISNAEILNLFSDAYAGPFTFLAPSNAAFAGYPQDQLDSLLQDQQKLLTLLKYHTLPGYYSVQDFITEHNRINGGNVNGLVRSTYTTQYFDAANSNVNNETLTSLVNSGFIKFYDAMSREAVMDRSLSDLPATNGIVHIVDSLLLPNDQLLPGNTVVDEVGRAGRDATVFYDLLKISGMSLNLARTGPFTVFAVTNAGLSKLGTGVIPYYTRRASELQTVLLHHTVEGSMAYPASTLLAASPLMTQQMEFLTIANTGAARLTIDGKAVITTPDVAASNGIVHFVDAFLPPAIAAFPTKTVYDYVNDGGYNQNNLNLAWSAFKEIMWKNDGALGDILKAPGPITLFLWDDASFNTNVDATLRTLLLSASSSAAYIGDALRYHVVNQYLDVGDLVAGSPGSVVTQDAPYSISYAVSTLTSRITLNGNVDITATIPANNGIIHIVSDVLTRNSLFPITPPAGTTDSLWDLLRLRPDVSDFYGYAATANINYLLQSTERRTLFAPKNDAFNDLPTGWKEIFKRNISVLHDVVQYHVLTTGSYAASLLPQISPAVTALGTEVLSFTQNSIIILIEANRVVGTNPASAKNRQATIQVPDLQASNGIMHVTDNLLIPESMFHNVLPFLDLYSLIEATPELSTMLSVLVTLSSRQGAGFATDLVTLLKGDGPLTVFAPSNTAFLSYPLLQSLMTWTPTTTNADDPLMALMQYHMHPLYKEENDLRLVSPTNLATLSTDTLTNSNMIDIRVEAGGTVVVLGGLARFTTINKRATNGVLHIIDTVLPATLPPGISQNSLQDVLQNRLDTSDFARTTPSVGLYNELTGTGGTGNLGPYTVFAPSNLAWSQLPIGVRKMLSQRLDVLTNVMRYHVVSGVALTAASTASTGSVVTLQGNTLQLEYNPNTGIVRLAGTAETIVTDIQATNGRAHVINQVLDYPNSPLPKQNLLNVISSDPALSTFSALLRASSTGALLATLDLLNQQSYTVLAPTDIAFSQLTAVEQQGYLSDPDTFLREHIIQNEYISSQDFHASSPGQKTNMNQNGVTYRIGVAATPGRDAAVLQQSGSSVVVFNYQTSRPSAVTGADIPATNGIVHVINQVLTGGTVTGGTGVTASPFSPPVPATTSAPIASVPSNQRVLVWGNALGGGDANTVAAALGQDSVKKVYSNDFAFVALPFSGFNMITWGDAVSGGAPPTLTGTSPVQDIFSTRRAFAALRADGSITAWGDARYGGDTGASAALLACCVSKVYATSRAFAAVRTSSSSNAIVVAWGDAGYGGAVPDAAQTSLNQMFLSGQFVEKIASNDGAFAAVVSRTNNVLTANVVTWGIGNQGGDSVTVSAFLTGVVDVVSTYSSFAAITSTGNVVTWGAADSGGDSTTIRALLSQGTILTVASTTTAFTALTTTGTAISWGNQNGGGESRSLVAQLVNVGKIFSTDSAFAALKSDGTVVTWGGSGGDSVSVASALTAIIDIASTDSAFAALRADGTVVTWGSSGFGGQVPASKQPLLVGVKKVYGNSRAFAAVRNDNTVVEWGDNNGGGNGAVPNVATAQLLVSPVIASGALERVIATTDAAFAAYIADPVVPVTPPTPGATPLPAPGSTTCSVLYCNGNHLSFATVANACVCNCKNNYVGDRCQICNVGYVNYPICSFAVVTPVPWFLPFTPTPSGISPPPTPLPSSLPLPTPPPTKCLGWSACNGHQLSVSDSPLGGCLCNCLENFAGETCDSCASGYSGYPICAQGNWVLVSETHACHMNVEDDAAVHGSETDLLPTRIACQQACSELPWCRAVDWYTSTQKCRMYRESCAKPLDPLNGGTHWRIVVDAGLQTPAPTPVPTVEPGCPWVSPSGREDEYDCGDGSTCNLRLQGTDCCSNRRGRLRCPVNYPTMCSSIDVDCDNDYCCVETPAMCIENGGVRPCFGMDVTPCGLHSQGGQPAVWFNGKSGQQLTPPKIQNVRSVFSNTEAYAAVTMLGAVITWGADYAGGDSSTVASLLLSGVVKVFSTDLTFAALKTGGEVVAWGDNGLGAASANVQSLLRSGVSTLYTTSNAFAAVKLGGGVVTWGHSFYGGDSSAVAGGIASNVKRIYSTTQAFAAVKIDGSVVTWGATDGGGNANSVQPLLSASPGVSTISNTLLAFAAIRNDGRVVTWGYSPRGGDSTTVNDLLLTGGLEVVGNTLAFALIKTNRAVVTWGDATAGGDSATVAQSLSSSVMKIFTTNTAFAALRSDGTVVAWGNLQEGGQIPAVKADLLRNVKTIVSTERAFTALLSDGTAVMWGDAAYGGTFGTANTISNVREVSSNQREFIALHNDGTISIWGEQPNRLGDVTVCETKLIDDVPAYRYGLGVRSVASTLLSFALLTEPDTTPIPSVLPTLDPSGNTALPYFPVKVWGDPLAGGVIPASIQSQLTCGSIYSTKRAFAAVKADGSVVAWGDSGYGGDTTSVAHRLSTGVTSLFSTDRAFAALTEGGSVIVWGDHGYGGNADSTVAAQIATGVQTVYSTQLAFAALKTNGQVVTWGDRYYGGESITVEPFIQTNVIGIYNTDQAFAAIKSDGSVVTWGAGFSGGDSSRVRQELLSGITAVYTTYSAFAAVKTGGSVVTWGYDGRGGDSSTVAGELLAGVQSIAGSEMAFAALKIQQGSQTAGTVVTWGDAGYGGDSTTVRAQLAFGVVAVYATQRAFAAIKTDGSVVAWGNASYGGFVTQLASQLVGVEEIFTTERSFAALLTSGRVVTWGDAGFGGQGGALQGITDVRVVYSTERSFTALRADGSLVAWGSEDYGGDMSGTDSSSASDHKAVYSTGSAFAALNPCQLGSKLRSVGVGACMGTDRTTGTTTRYGELKTDAVDRAACLQVLLQHSPPARGATWWPDAPLVGAARGGCYVAVDLGSTLSTGVWSDRFSYDTSPYDPNAKRTAEGPVTQPSGDIGMECIAADEASAVPTPPPGTNVPEANPTPAPGTTSYAWSLTQKGASCQINNEGINVVYNFMPLASLEACMRACEVHTECRAVDYFDTGLCNLYDKACTEPLDIHSGAEAWRYVAGTSDGFEAVAWGDPTTGGETAAVFSQVDRGVRAIYNTEYAFAALKTDGTVVTWGSGPDGGDSNSVNAELRLATASAIVDIAGSDRAFAALTSTGSVVTWGDSQHGGSSELVRASLMSGVRKIYAADAAFAALTPTGLIAWGNQATGGDATTVANAITGTVEYRTVQPSERAFAALTEDGQVVAWGDMLAGGDTTTVAIELGVGNHRVTNLYSTKRAFAALRDDKSVITWGDASRGGDMTSVAGLLSSQVLRIYSTESAFAALKQDGTVIAWGSILEGGAAPPMDNVRFIVTSKRAFVAIKNDGTAVTWGDPLAGGDRPSTPTTNTFGITSAVGNDEAFAAVLSNGALDAWGNAVGGGTLPTALNMTQSYKLQYLTGTSQAFAGLTEAGAVVAWGNNLAGGDVNPVASRLARGVVSISSTSRSFAALVTSLTPFPASPASSDVMRCTEDMWQTSPLKRCISGINVVGEVCDQYEILGGAVATFSCAYRTRGSDFVCVRCDQVETNLTAAPPPGTAPARDEALTAGNAHTVTVCSEQTDRSTGSADQELTIACPAGGGTLLIHDAYFGRPACSANGGALCVPSSNSIPTCATQECNDPTILTTIREQCQGLTGCNLATVNLTACPSLSKYLQVSYTCQAYVCEQRSVVQWGRSTGQSGDQYYDMRCSADRELVIDYAIYGRTTCFQHVCYSTPGTNCATQTCSVNVTSTISALCDGKQTCQVSALSAELGAAVSPDPCPGENKYLDVGYSCQGRVGQVSTGACIDINGGYYREFKKSQVDRTECAKLLRKHQPYARAAMYADNLGCYIAVDSDKNITLPGTAWDSEDSTDSYAGVRLGKGALLSTSNNADNLPAGAICIAIGATSLLPPVIAPPPGTGGSTNGNGLCGQPATALDQCEDNTNAYWCNGLCCCEEQREFRCNPATGKCVAGFVPPPDTPLPAPTSTRSPSPDTISPDSPNVPGGSSSTHPPNANLPASGLTTASDDDSMGTTWIILLIALGLLCLCCIFLAFYCGTRSQKNKQGAESPPPESPKSPAYVPPPPSFTSLRV